MPKRWNIDNWYVVFYPLNFTNHGHPRCGFSFSFVACSKISLFHLFACNKGKSRHLHAGLEDVTNKNCLPQTLSLMLIDGLTLLYNWHFIIGTIMLWNLGPFCTSRQTWNLKLWNNSELKTVWWQFCFCKIDSHWKLFTINRPSHLST